MKNKLAEFDALKSKMAGIETALQNIGTSSSYADRADQKELK